MNLGAPEILFLVFLGVLLFGPEKLPEFARKAARVVNYLRGIANDARGQIASELGPEFANIKTSDLNPRGLVRHLVDGAEVGSVTAAASGVAQEFRATAAMLPTLTGVEDSLTAGDPELTEVESEVPTGPPFDPEAT